MAEVGGAEGGGKQQTGTDLDYALKVSYQEGDIGLISCVGDEFQVARTGCLRTRGQKASVVRVYLWCAR